MNGISISVTQLLIKGVPEGLLIILALHIFTGTKVESKKYLPLCAAYIIAIYGIRFLPITLGVNTMLSILIMILLFQAVYRASLAKVIRLVTSSVIITILVAVSEALNFLAFYILFGQDKTNEYMNSGIPIIRSVSTIPSTLFFALFIFIGHLILKYINKRKQKDGEAGQKTGE